jgi:hypothetical protein
MTGTAAEFTKKFCQTLDQAANHPNPLYNKITSFTFEYVKRNVSARHWSCHFIYCTSGPEINMKEDSVSLCVISDSLAHQLWSTVS